MTERHVQVHTQMQLYELCITDSAKQVLHKSRDSRVKLCQCGTRDPGITGNLSVNFCVTLDPGHASGPAGFIRHLLKSQPQKQRGTAAGVPGLSAESWCFDSVTQSSILCTWGVAALRCQSLSWHVLLKLSTRKQVWSSISPAFPKVSRCFRKWVWSLILWHVPAFILGLQVSKAHGVQSFSGLLSPHKEACHLQTNEYSPNVRNYIKCEEYQATKSEIAQQALQCLQ